MRAKTKKVLIFVVFLLLIALVAAVLFNIEKIGAAISGKNNDNTYPPSSGDIEKEMNTVYIDGEEYYRKKNVVNYLVMGIDKYGESDDGGIGQADFIMAVSFDVVEKTYTLVPINRDTMTLVNVYDIFGKDLGERVEQIALSHAYGGSSQLSNPKKCENTKKSVQKLLYGVKFKEYVSMTMDAVSGIVDRIGGVDIYMSEDWSEIDPRYQKGETVTLDGASAMTFIRARGSLSDSTNIARMRRQQAFLEAFIKKLGDTNMNDEELLQAYDDLAPYLVTSAGADPLLEMADKLASYTDSGTVSIPGEAKVGNGYMEFYVDENGLKDIVKEVFFDKSEE